MLDLSVKRDANPGRRIYCGAERYSSTAYVSKLFTALDPILCRPVAQAPTWPLSKPCIEAQPF
jgi:hypothetical protein